MRTIKMEIDNCADCCYYECSDDEYTESTFINYSKYCRKMKIGFETNDAFPEFCPFKEN